MSEVKFTKGEWVTDGDWVTCEGNAVCMMGDSWVNYDNFRENAHLIAAAPEMYDMLERLSRLSCDESIGDGNSWDIRELLAKARGE